MLISWPQELSSSNQGPEWVLAKKSEKRVMTSSMGDARGLLKEFRRIWFLVGGFGGPPPENF